MDLVAELGPDPLPVAVLGLQLLQLHLQLLLLVLHLLLGLAQDSQLSGQVRVLFLQRLLVLVQVGLGLAREAEGEGGVRATAGASRGPSSLPPPPLVGPGTCAPQLRGGTRGGEEHTITSKTFGILFS